MLSAPISTYLYATHGPTSIILLMGTIPLVVMLPLVYRFREEFHPVVMSPRQQVSIWESLRYLMSITDTSACI